MRRIGRGLFLCALIALLVWFGRAVREERERGVGLPAEPSSTGGPRAADALVEPAPPADAGRSSPAPSASAPSPARSTPTIRVRVVTADGRQPVAGALVESYEREAHVETETDGDGVCVVPVADSVLWPAFHVRKAGFVHKVTRLERHAELEIALARGATLHGRVLDAETGAPLPSVRLLLGRESCRCAPEEATTDALGRYELACVPLRTPSTQIGFEADGFPRQEKTFELRSDAERIEQDFVLERGLELVGCVVDSITSAGVVGATVAGFPTDPAGHFRSYVMAPKAEGDSIDVRAPGYCRLSARLSAAELARAEPLEFRLPRVVSVDGVVRDPQGNALAGVDLVAEREPEVPPSAESSEHALPEGWRLDMDRVYPTAHTGADGRFHLTGLVPWDHDTTVSAMREGWKITVAHLERVAEPGATMALELVLEPEPPPTTAWISGEVSVNGSRGGWQGTVHWQGATREGEETFAHGSYRAEVESGHVTLRFELDGIREAPRGAELELDALAGAQIDRDVELHLPLQPIRGRARFPDGSPARGAEVEALCPLPGSPHGDPVRFAAALDADGRFAFAVPSLGTAYRVEASLGQQADARDGVAPGEGELEFVFARPATLRFRLRDARTRADLAVWNFRFFWRPSGEPEFRLWAVGLFAQPDPDGWYEDALASGLVDLEVRANSSEYRALAMERVALPLDGEPARVEFLLEPGLVLALKLAPGSEPVPEPHQIFLVEDELWAEVHEGQEPGRHDVPSRVNLFGREAKFDEQGTATLHGLAPGRFRFKVFPDDLVVEPAEVLVGEERGEPVLVRWHRAR